MDIFSKTADFLTTILVSILLLMIIVQSTFSVDAAKGGGKNPDIKPSLK